MLGINTKHGGKKSSSEGKKYPSNSKCVQTHHCHNLPKQIPRGSENVNKSWHSCKEDCQARWIIVNPQMGVRPQLYKKI